MNKQAPTKINVPDELRDVLLEFTISYLLEQPPDVVNYAVQFFTKLRDNRGKPGVGVSRKDSPDSILGPEEGKLNISRFGLYDRFKLLGLDFLPKLSSRPL